MGKYVSDSARALTCGAERDTLVLARVTVRDSVTLVDIQDALLGADELLRGAHYK